MMMNNRTNENGKRGIHRYSINKYNNGFCQQLEHLTTSISTDYYYVKKRLESMLYLDVDIPYLSTTDKAVKKETCT